MTPVPDRRLGELALGRYRLVEVLGAGSTGTVYRAEQRVGRFVREVAVKVLHAHARPGSATRARFLRESEIVVQLRHASTIRFFDLGQLDDGALAIVMELVRGESLADRIARGPLTLDEVRHIVAQIAGSLDEAHALGVVHRDLKPENVLLFERPGSPLPGVKVVDFGIAKQRGTRDVADDEVSTRGEVLGTPRYMSPEQICGVDTDARADVYALGLLAYEMLTGGPPFRPARGVVQWAERHLFDDPTPIGEHPLGRELSPEARSVLARALAKAPENRPSGVWELAIALGAAAPPEAREPAARAALRRFGRRGGSRRSRGRATKHAAAAAFACAAATTPPDGASARTARGSPGPFAPAAGLLAAIVIGATALGGVFATREAPVPPDAAPPPAAAPLEKPPEVATEPGVDQMSIRIPT